MASNNIIKIYSGISLDEKTIKKYIPNAQFQKPIQRKDLYQDLKNGTKIVGIVDGEFIQNLAVSPIEILDVMRCGLKVFGSSSMGALRAAELDHYGMVGIGSIYKHIKSEKYFNDEYLGQIFFEDATFASTIPLIDIYFILIKLTSDKKYTNQLIKKISLVHFSQRTISYFKSFFQNEISNPQLKEKIIKSISDRKNSEKFKNGIELLKSINQYTKNTDLINKIVWKKNDINF